MVVTVTVTVTVSSKWMLLLVVAFLRRYYLSQSHHYPLDTMSGPEGEGTTPLPSSDTRHPPEGPPLPLSPVLVRAIFLLLGVGILIPWNAFVSAKPYFQARLCKDGEDVINFELWFGLVWNISSVCSLGLIIASVAIKDAFCKKINEREASRISSSNNTTSDNRSMNSPSSHNSGASHRSNNSHPEGHSILLVMVPLALYLVVFAITDLLVLIPSIDPHKFMSLTLASLALCGTCGAIATAGIVSTAGLFESHLGIAPFFSGQALGGVAVSLANFIAATMEDPTIFWEQSCEVLPFNETTATSVPVGDFLGDTQSGISDVHNRRIMLQDDSRPGCSPYTDLDWAVFGYFFAGCVVLACCLVGYTVINRYRQQEYRDDYEAVQDSPLVLDEQSPRVGLEMKEQRDANEECLVEPTIIPATQSYHDANDGLRPEPPSTTMTVGGANGVETFEDELIVESEEYSEEENELAVFSAIKGPATCIFLVFTGTLCLFPSWVSQLRSAHECQAHFRLWNDLYVPMSFVVFNVGDLTGRVLSEKVPVTHIRHMSTKLVLAALCRLVFLPLFLLCVTEHRRSPSSSWLAVIPSDFYSTTVQFFFALTNGLLVSCSFMHAPSLVAHNSGMQERASEIMTFAVSFGLLSGSMLSFPFANVASKL